MKQFMYYQTKNKPNLGETSTLRSQIGFDNQRAWICFGVCLDYKQSSIT